MRAAFSGYALFLAAMLAASPAFAGEQAPEAVLKAATAQQGVLPLFDFARMTETVAARHWWLASPEQQKRLIGEFRTLIARTYAAALAHQSDHAIEYRRGRMAPGAMYARVRSQARQPGGERMSIDYDMEKTSEGWKIYDIKLHGVSLIATYRETFADAVRDRGLNGLIGLLSEDNRRGGASAWTGGAAAQGGSSLVALAMLYSAVQGRR
jgi:phospholipid transport system substrate-binding protein